MTTATKFVYTDEVGNRVAGFTVRQAGAEPTYVQNVGDLDKVGADAWASVTELKVWLSRYPEFWGDGSISATFLVAGAEGIEEVEVSREEVAKVVERD